jgi:hypothetical protein
MPSTYSGNRTTGGRTAVAIGVLLAIALVHAFRLGSRLRGRLFVLYYSYFSDVVIPFGMYFLLCLEDTWVRFLRDWRLKALLVFGVASLIEVLQGFGVPLFGRTFDPFDFAMYASGVLLAVLVDRLVLDRLFPRAPRGRTGGTSHALSWKCGDGARISDPNRTKGPTADS